MKKNAVKILCVVMACLILLPLAVLLPAASAETVGLHGEKNDFDFSELHIVESLSDAAPFGRGKDMYYGGNAQDCMAYFSRWDGPVEESAEPYDSYEFGDELNYESHPLSALAGDIYSITNTTAEIKKAVMEYGALYVGFFTNDEYYNEETCAYYTPVGMMFQGAHAVAIVGWDDNYSKKNFNHTPPGNGAFIIKNSWGDWGDDGYFYLSYYSFMNEVTAFTVLPTDPGYNKIYQYDETGITTTVNKLYDDIEYAVNVFPQAGSTLAADETLKAVSFYTSISNTPYTITIVTDVKDKNDLYNKLKTGDCVSISGTMEHGGYHVLNLDTPITLKAGTRFAVAMKLNDRLSILRQFACETPIKENPDARANKGESFYTTDGMIFDLCDETENTNWCIKAFTEFNSSSKNGVKAAKGSKRFYQGISSDRAYESNKIHSVSSLIERGFRFSEDFINYINGVNVIKGYVPASAEIKSTAASSSSKKLPSYYDLRDEGFVTTIKDQNPFGTCWAFAATASLESNALKMLSETDSGPDFTSVQPDRPASASAAPGKPAYFSFTAPYDEDYTFSVSGEDVTVEKVNALGKAAEKTENPFSVKLDKNQTFSLRITSDKAQTVTVNVTPACVYDESKIKEFAFTGNFTIDCTTTEGEYDIFRIVNMSDMSIIIPYIESEAPVEVRIITPDNNKYTSGKITEYNDYVFVEKEESFLIAIRPSSGSGVKYSIELTSGYKNFDPASAIPVELNEYVPSNGEDILYSFTAKENGYYFAYPTSTFLDDSGIDADSEWYDERNEKNSSVYMKKGETLYFFSCFYYPFNRVIKLGDTGRPPLLIDGDGTYGDLCASFSDHARFALTSDTDTIYVLKPETDSPMTYEVRTDSGEADFEIINLFNQANLVIPVKAGETVYLDVYFDEIDLSYALPDAIFTVSQSDTADITGSAEEFIPGEDFEPEAGKIYKYTPSEDCYLWITCDGEQYFSYDESDETFRGTGNLITEENVLIYGATYAEAGKTYFFTFYPYEGEIVQLQEAKPGSHSSGVASLNGGKAAVRGSVADDIGFDFDIDYTGIEESYSSVLIRFENLDPDDYYNFIIRYGDGSEEEYNSDELYIIPAEDGISIYLTESRITEKSPVSVTVMTAVHGWLRAKLVIDNDVWFGLTARSRNIDGNAFTVRYKSSFRLETYDIDFSDLIIVCDNENIATISEDGVVRGISPGATKFTVSTADGSYSETYTLYVRLSWWQKLIRAIISLFSFLK